MNIVYSYFVLDIVHRGHLLMLRNSKAIAGPDGRLDLSRFSAAPSARLSHFPFESDGAFPAQC